MVKTLIFVYFSLSIVICALKDIDLSLLNSEKVIYYKDPNLSNQFGISARGVGDLNQDGCDDVIIGASDANVNADSINEGLVYVVYGNKSLTSMNDIGTEFITPTHGFKITDLTNSDQLGISVSGAGDFNGNGVTDLLVGAHGGNGRAYIIFGDKNRNTDVDLSLLNSNTRLLITGGASFSLGSAVDTAGDMNGDGIDDIIISASYANSLRGYVYIIFGKKSAISDLDLSINDDVRTSNIGFRIQGGIQYAQLGASVSAAGDVNGDGIDDIIVGATYYYPTLPYYGPGKAYVIYGNKDYLPNIDLSQGLNSTQGFTIYSTEVGNCLGYSVSGAGDINDDGISDVIVGAYLSTANGRIGAGAAYIIFGKENGPSDFNVNVRLRHSQGFQILGANAGDSFGIAVASAGDFNGDGIDDVVIGASTASPDPLRITAGITYVIYGRKNGFSDIDLTAGLEETQGFQIHGANTINSLGIAVSSAGDVNGDGTNDLIIGSSYHAGSTYGGGLAYIILGTPFIFIDVLKGVTKATSIISKVIQGSAIVITAVNFVDAAMIRLNCLFEMIMYIRYLRITYPERLQYILDQPDPDLISIGFIDSLSEKIDIQASSNSIPGQFAKYGYYPSFFANFLPSIIFLVGILLIMILAIAFNYFTRSSPKIHSFSTKFKQVMKWNYSLAYFTGYFSDISLVSSLEFRSVTFSSFLSIFSFILGLLINFVAIAVIVKLIIIIRRLRQAKLQSTRSQDPSHFESYKDTLKDYQIVYEPFKDDSFLKLAYMAFFAIRLYLFNLIIGYLFEYPLVQTIIINVIGIIILVYLGLKRPFKKKIEFVSTLSQEIILQIVNGCALGLAVIEIQDTGSDGARILFGDIIIACNVLFTLIAAIYTLYALIALSRSIYNTIKKKKTLYTENNGESGNTRFSRVRKTSSADSNEQDIDQASANDASAMNNLVHETTTHPEPSDNVTEIHGITGRNQRSESIGNFSENWTSRSRPFRSFKDMKSLNLLRSYTHRNTLFGENSINIQDIQKEKPDLRYCTNYYESQNEVYGRRTRSPSTPGRNKEKEKEMRKTKRGERPFNLPIKR